MLTFAGSSKSCKWWLWDSGLQLQLHLLPPLLSFPLCLRHLSRLT